MSNAEMREAMLAERFRLVADMNRDGSFTVSDIWAWFKFIYFAPGDLMALTMYGTPIGRFFEVTADSIGGWASGVFSFWVWLIALGLISSALDN